MTSLVSTRNEEKNLICRELMHMSHTYMYGHLCFSQITGNIVISKFQKRPKTFKMLGWCPAWSVLPHGEVPL